ncbi:hypothetical protein ACVD45_04910 [Staphylococcus aureus]
MKTLRNIFITIVVIAIIVIGGLFGLNAYSNQHPNNHSINDWNKLNPLAQHMNITLRLKSHRK